MKDGFIKAAAATVKITVADTVSNTENIIELINKAEKLKINLLVLPELCVTGYTCGDLFLSDKLISSAESALIALTKATEGKYPIVAVGLPLLNRGKLYDCTAVLHDGKILGIVPKTYIDKKTEARYFTSGENAENVIYLNGEEIPFGNNLIFSHGEMDPYSFGFEIGSDFSSPATVSTALCLSGAYIICNPCADTAQVGQQEYKELMCKAASSRLVCGYISANADCSESTQDSVFSKHLLIAEKGKILAENKSLSNSDIIVTEIDVANLRNERRKNGSFNFCSDDCEIIEFNQEIKETKLTRKFELNPFVPQFEDNINKRAEEILNIQAHGLKKRIEHTHAKCAVIGISGGLDSTLAILVAFRAMKLLNRPASDITAITMPCFGTTKRTKSNAVKLCELLGVTLKTVNITESVKQHFEDIGQDTNHLDVTYENSQARERTQVLMDIANMKNGLVIGTGDLSELALGWATYNGDHMSMYGVNASVPKTLVRCLVSYEASVSDNDLKNILLDILDTPVSPELLPADKNGNIAQKTEDLVGPYELHDFFLYRILRFGETPSKIYRLACYVFEDIYSKETVLKWLKTFTRRFFNQQFKRSCLPDGPKVGTVNLSPRGEWCMPTDASSRIWLDEIEKLK